MNLSSDTISRILESTLGADGSFDYANEYGEPGYGSVGTTMVVLGNYWCRCDKLGTDDNGRVNLHDHAAHHPRIWQQMEDQGVEFEWCDEWCVDYDAGKAYRTQPDSYSWQPTAMYTEDGDLLTPDSDIDEWIEWAADEPTRCLMRRYRDQLQGAGFVKWEPGNEQDYQSGWHEGMTDDPKAVTDQIRQALGDGAEIVFVLDETSQFYVGFSVWTRETDETDED